MKEKSEKVTRKRDKKGDKEEVKSRDMHPLHMQNMWESEREALAFLLRRNTIFTIAGRMQFCCAVIRHYVPGCGTLASCILPLFYRGSLASRSKKTSKLY